jgi:hypothetical protein
MRAQQRLLHGLVGIGLRAEQRHAQPAEHAMMRARARRDRGAVIAARDELGDRIDLDRHHRDRSGSCLHLAPHVRASCRFVTEFRQDLASSRNRAGMHDPTREPSTGANG